MSKKAIIVGWINKGRIADCGETVKNQLMIKALQENGIKCYQCDFKNWKKHPWVIIELLIYMIVHRDATLIFATTTKNIYGFLKILKRIKWKQNIVHWVIGGTLGQKVQDKIFDASVIGYANHTLVESKFMAEQLEKNNIRGVKQVPNFKIINYYPALPIKYPDNGQKLRLVFLSRIMPEKGCDYILDAASQLNSEHMQDKYEIDFYGKIAGTYEESFKDKVEKLPNVNYRGFLNFSKKEAYDQLANYDLMLFPTYWVGEGFAGVFIDAFISGVPIIATDWAHNKAFLVEGKDAIFIQPHDVNGIVDTIRKCIDGKYDLNKMANECQDEAPNYSVEKVITKELLDEIGIL